MRRGRRLGLSVVRGRRGPACRVVPATEEAQADQRARGAESFLALDGVEDLLAGVLRRPDAGRTRGAEFDRRFARGGAGAGQANLGGLVQIAVDARVVELLVVTQTWALERMQIVII